MILVTGATGTVGREIVRELLQQGANFRVAAHRGDRVQAVLGPGIDSVPFDYEDPDSVKRALESAKRVYLLTPGQENAEELAERTIEAAREAGVELVVRQSAFGADDHPGYLLGRTHRQVELYLLASALPAVVLRPNSFMENFLNFQGDTIRREQCFYLPLRDARVSYIAARDVGAVAAEILMSDDYTNKSFDLTGPEAVTCEEVADALTRALGQEIRYIDISPDQFRQAMSGAPAAAVDMVLSLYEYDRSGATARITHTVEEITGRPAQDIRSWAMEHAAQFSERVPV